MRRSLRGAVLATLVGLGVAAVPASAGTVTDVPLLHGGTLRSYRLYVPGALPAARKVPLVLALHGLSGTPAGMAKMTGFDALAERHGFVVAYPEGRWSSWNAGTCCGDASAAGVDDVGFLTDVVRTLSLTLPVDPARVYAAGFSNGGMMALRLGCERPDVFAAVASVTGTLQAPCRPSAPVSALQVTGGADGLVPYRGQPWSEALRASLTPVPVAVGALERGALCSGLPARTRSGAAEVRSYASCAGGASVRLAVLPRESHVWPTASRHGWAGTEEVWRFFRDRALAGAQRRAPVLTTRLVASRTAGGDVVGRLDGRFDVVIGRRIVVDVRRGGRWVAAGSVTTDVEGAFAVRGPREAVRLRYAGTPGLPSSVTVA